MACSPSSWQCLQSEVGGWLTGSLAAVFLIASMVFVYRSFYSMRIDEKLEDIKIEVVKAS